MDAVIPISTCPRCGFSAALDFADCPRCGIVIEKYLRLQREGCPRSEKEISGRHPPSAPLPGAEPGNEEADSPNLPEILRAVVLHVPDAVNPIAFAGRTLLFLGLLVLGGWFMLSPLDPETFGGFIHLVNLPFHEAGHLIFRPFGHFITSLGGTLGQLLMPVVCMAVFLIQTRDPFAGSVCLWWVGQNFMDIAPYINDARTGVLPLLGGNTGQSSPYGFHDWEYLLTETGLMRYDHSIANLSHGAGCFLMLTALAWGGYLLRQQYRCLDSAESGAPG